MIWFSVSRIFISTKNSNAFARGCRLVYQKDDRKTTSATYGVQHIRIEYTHNGRCRAVRTLFISIWNAFVFLRIRCMNFPKVMERNNNNNKNGQFYVKCIQRRNMHSERQNRVHDVDAMASNSQLTRRTIHRCAL